MELRRETNEGCENMPINMTVSGQWSGSEINSVRSDNQTVNTQKRRKKDIEE